MSKIITGVMLLASLMMYRSLGAETISVRQAVRSAFAVNPLVNVARAGYHRTKAQRLLELSPEPASMALEYSNMPSGEAISAHEERTLSLSQDIEFPAKYFWGVQAASIAVEEARIKALTQLLELEIDVRNAYIQAWLIDEQYEIIKRNAEQADTYAQQIKRLVELGESAPLEERRAAVEAMRANVQHSSVKKERKSVLNNFQSLTGIDLSGKEMNEPFTLFEPLVIHFDDSYAVQEARLQSETANIDHRAAVYNWLPDIEATYFMKNIPAEPDSDNWGVEFGISLPIWFWFGGRGEIQAAKANNRAAEGNLEHVRLSEKIDTATLYNSQTVLRKRLELYQSQIYPLAEEAYKIARKSYDLGEASYLDVIDAQRTLFDIQHDHLEIKSELATVNSEIDRLTCRSLIGSVELMKLLEKGN